MHAVAEKPMSTGTRFSSVSWTLLMLYLLWLFVLKVFAIRILPIYGVHLTEQLLLTAFFVVHALGFYSGREVAFYAIGSAVVSNALENTSVLYGFPFGYYVHTELGGPKLLNVPFTVTLLYVAMGYISWMAAQVLLRRTSYASATRLVWVTPMVAAFVFTSWDLCVDPIYGTVYRAFIYRDPGAWFGTPVGNYFGWMLTTYIFYLAFSLYLNVSAGKRERDVEPATSYWLQPVLIYLGVALSIILADAAGQSVDITLANGKTWNSGDIYGASALVTVFTMGFTSSLAFVALFHRDEATRAR